MEVREVVQEKPSTFLIPATVLVAAFRAAPLNLGDMSLSTGIQVTFSSSFMIYGQNVSASLISRRAVVPVRERTSAASSSSRRFKGISTRLRPTLTATLVPVQD